MFVAANSQPVTPDRIRTTRIGEKFNVDSHLGGSFSVEFRGISDGHYIFKNLSPEFSELVPEFSYPSAEDASKHVFLLVPAECFPLTPKDVIKAFAPVLGVAEAQMEVSKFSFRLIEGTAGGKPFRFTRDLSVDVVWKQELP